MHRIHYRFGIVLALIIVAIFFVMAAPHGDVARFVSVCLQAAVLVAAVIASKAPRSVIRLAVAAAVVGVVGSGAALFGTGEFGNSSAGIVALLYVLLTPPTVGFETDDDLTIGEFGIATRMAQGTGRAAEQQPAAQLEPGATMVYKPRPPLPDDGPQVDVALAQEIVTLTLDGKRHEVDKRRVVIGRSKECNIQLSDPNASRRHAELRQEGSAYWLVDLDSTNGSAVNGQRTARAKLESGDTITIGSTDLEFERRLAP